MKKLSAQEVEQILDSPMAAVVRKVAKLQQVGNNTNTPHEARIRVLGIEIDRGTIDEMKRLFNYFKNKQITCELLTRKSRDTYYIAEEYLR